jgi:hypothetical protein
MTKLNTLRTASAVALFIGAMAATDAARADQVFNDDVIITGSLCVGFDCANGMAFGSDTIVLQENQLRIFFNDTSTLSGFPSNDWRLIANDPSGSASYFAIEDATAARQVFRVTAGARSNSIFVSSGGNVGFGTSTPAQLMHGRNSNTPGLRLEQDASGGFSPQTWDVAGNEANFFIRDVTGGSRLPFRIRPGAPTSSIDIAASGNVGFGTASPQITASGAGIDIVSASNPEMHLHHTASGTAATDGANIALSNTDFFITNREAGNTIFFVNGAERMRIASGGAVSIAGLANCGSGVKTDGSGTFSCIVSSRRFKNIAGPLPYQVALANVMALRPEVGAYKKTPNEPEHWLIAEDVAAVDPALAGFADGKPYTVKTQNVVADLVAVVQYQQRQIDGLKQALAENSKH